MARPPYTSVQWRQRVAQLTDKLQYTTKKLKDAQLRNAQKIKTIQSLRDEIKRLNKADFDNSVNLLQNNLSNTRFDLSVTKSLEIALRRNKELRFIINSLLLLNTALIIIFITFIIKI